MSDEKIILSIIMPIYNEAEHLAFAIESVLMQETDFSYEIIIVDDCSDDNTADIVEAYRKAYPHIIRYHLNEKNSGNAFTFWQGLTLSRGDFFHVLDGDDFFIRRDKLQRQINFLQENQGFSAVATNSLRLLNNGQFYTELHPSHSRWEYRYEDALAFSFYCHTSSYMYRNIYRDNVPSFLKEEWARGDGIRTVIHAKHGKIKVLNFIGSVYRFHQAGIWSSMSRQQQNDRLIWALENMIEHIATTKSEKDILQNRILFSKKMRGKSKKLQLLQLLYRSPADIVKKLLEKDSRQKLHRFLFEKTLLITPEKKLSKIRTHISHISYGKKTTKKVFKECYFAQEYDQFCEAIGKLYLDKINFSWLKHDFRSEKVVILVSGIQNKSGGTLREIIELIDIHTQNNQEIVILSTEMVRTDEVILQDIPAFQYENVKFKRCTTAHYLSTEVQIHSIIDELITLKPSRMYPFASHNDVVMACAIQTGLAKEIVLDFCLDHGISFMSTSSAINNIIVKLPYHYHMLSKIIHPRNITYIPFFIKDTPKKPSYVPLQDDSINTMTASARNYKVMDYKYPYETVIAQLLLETKGKHIHVGPLSPEQVQRILDKLTKYNVAHESFKHIPWSNSLTDTAQENKIDIYLQSFPVGAGRTTIEMLRAAIPVVNHKHYNSVMFNASDYCPDACPIWEKPSDLIAIIKQMDRQTLIQISKEMRQFYEENNTFEGAKKATLHLESQDQTYHSRYEDIKTFHILNDFKDHQESIAYKIKNILRRALKKMRLYKTVQKFRNRRA